MRGIALRFREHFSLITCLDVAQITREECGISKIIGNTPKNLLIIQNNVFFRLDVPGSVIFYFHIDGAQSFHPNQINFAFYLFNALGVHDYEVAENQKTLIPFVEMNEYNPNRKKDIKFSNISRDIPFDDYKDQLERSEFTIIRASIWLSKRALASLASRTIPLIITEVPEMYYRMGYQDDFCALIASPQQIPEVLKRNYNRDKGYEWVKKYHSAEVRVKSMIPFMKKYLI